MLQNPREISGNKPKKVAASVLSENLGWTDTESPRMTDVYFRTTDVLNMTFYKAVMFTTTAGHWAVGINHNRNLFFVFLIGFSIHPFQRYRTQQPVSSFQKFYMLL